MSTNNNITNTKKANQSILNSSNIISNIDNSSSEIKRGISNQNLPIKNKVNADAKDLKQKKQNITAVSVGNKKIK